MKILIFSLLTFAQAKIFPTSFEETHRRYLAPLDMIELYVQKYPDWLSTICDPYHGLSQNASALKTLLGENRPSTGEPDTWVPSVGLVTLLQTCLKHTVSIEVARINTSGRVEASLQTLSEIIPDSKALGRKWDTVRLNELSPADQELLVRALIQRVWGTLIIYEEFNLGKSLDQLVLQIREQLKEKTLDQVYTQVLVWASLRDEFLMY